MSCFIHKAEDFVFFIGQFLWWLNYSQPQAKIQLVSVSNVTTIRVYMFFVQQII